MTSTASLLWYRVDHAALTAAEAAFHPGHFDPVSSDPITSIIVRLALAAFVGLVAGIATWIPASRLFHGDVVPVLLVNVATGVPIVDVEDWQAGVALAVVGGLLAPVAMAGTILAFGRLGLMVANTPLSLQTILAGVLGWAVLFLVPAYLFLPRHEDAVSSMAAVRKHWLTCALSYGLVFVAAKTVAFALLFV